ncbi:hypothetical protein FLG15_20645 [Xanthomonas phaseoli pv. dieffenbachiae]
MSSWNLLGKGYEKIPLLASANLWGDYPPTACVTTRQCKPTTALPKESHVDRHSIAQSRRA